MNGKKPKNSFNDDSEHGYRGVILVLGVYCTQYYTILLYCIHRYHGGDGVAT